MSGISLYHYIGLMDIRNLLWSVCESCKSNHILWLPHWKRLCLDWVIFLANLRPPLRQCDIFLTGIFFFEYSFESFSSRERIGNIICYEIIDFNCKGRKQILHAWKMFLWRANQMHQLNFDNRFPIESKCFLLIALERVTQRFSASGCQRQNRLFIKFNIWCAPPLFEQKFRIWPNLALPHSAGNIINSVQPLNNLIISTSSISLTLTWGQ